MSSGGPVIIVGAGWAGLAAGVELAKSGVPIVILEAARQAGGRARSIRFGDLTVDNGQHILLGACGAVIGLLAELGIAEADAFVRLPLALTVRGPDGETVGLQASQLPAPFGIGIGFARAAGLTRSERIRGTIAGMRLLAGNPEARTVAQVLESTGHPARVREAIWEPLCLAALNTPATSASARVFRDVLRTALLGRRGASDLLLPKRSLASLVPEPALQLIRRTGNRVELRTTARRLVFRRDAVRGVDTGAGRLEGAQVILATSPRGAARLLDEDALTRPLAEVPSGVREHDITTVYLRYPDHMAIDPPLQGMTGTRAQWVIDRRTCDQPGLLAAVTSASDTGRDESAAHVAGEVARTFPELPPPLDTLSVRERRATFAATPAYEPQRPGPATSVAGLYLAGDWTDTGLPGTLEGAVRSGQRVAREIIAERSGIPVEFG